ncbi:MAG: hypothetical protein LBM70_00305 [Victivallales bacterium]|nr:hypothetical protein [Victivallales bacterium]
MKYYLATLSAALLFCVAAGAEVDKSSATPVSPVLPGAVKVGDALSKIGTDGKPETLTRSGDTVIYQKNGASTLVATPKGKIPQYIQDSKGRVVQLTPAPATKPIVHNPNPAATANRPTPVARPTRPTYSSMPSSPFLRPNPASSRNSLPRKTQK